MKDETLDQIKGFTETLDRLNRGDVTLNSKISSMRNVCIFVHFGQRNRFIGCCLFCRQFVKRLLSPLIPKK